MNQRLMFLMGLILVLGAACNPATPTTLPPLPTQQPQSTVVITLTPRPEPTGTPTPEPIDLQGAAGFWRLNFRYELTGGAVIDQIRFIGGVNVQVNNDGTLIGQGSLLTAVQHPGCIAQITDDGEIKVSVEGEALLGDAGLELVISLVPDEPGRIEHYSLRCPEYTELIEFEQQTLWPALEALSAQPYVLPLQLGASLVTSEDVTGPSRQRLQGTLSTEIRLSR